MSEWLSKLFARSPFGPFQDHMRKVQECVHLLPELADKIYEGNLAQVREVAKKISQIEHDADEIKNAVRDRLPNTIFMPVDRNDMLEVLSAQDAIADAAEDVAVIATMRVLRFDEDLRDLFGKLLAKTLETADLAAGIVESLDELVEASFSGAEARRIQDEISKLGRMEHEADKIQDQITRRVYQYGESWPAPDFYVWMQIVRKIGDVANAAERMGNRLRTFVVVR